MRIYLKILKEDKREKRECIVAKYAIQLKFRGF